MKDSMQPNDLSLVDVLNKPLKPPHLHPTPKDKGWSLPFGDSDSDDDDGNGSSDEDKGIAGTQKDNTNLKMYTVTFGTGSLGMTLNTNPNQAGCYVNKVVSGSQAAQASVWQGHKIIKIDGIDVLDATQAMQLLKTKPRPVKIVFGRRVAAAAAPAAAAAASTTTVAEEDKDTVQKKVLIMRKIRDKKLELTQTSDPVEKAKIKSELEVLVKRLQAIDRLPLIKKQIKEKEKDLKEETNPGKREILEKDLVVLKNKLSGKPIATRRADIVKEEKEEEGETYTMTVKPGSIGLGLVPRGSDDEALGVKISTVAAGSQAEQVDEIGEGDYLIKINETSVRQKSMSQVMSLLKETKRPFVLTFELGEDEDSD